MSKVSSENILEELFSDFTATYVFARVHLRSLVDDRPAPATTRLQSYKSTLLVTTHNNEERLQLNFRNGSTSWQRVSFLIVQAYYAVLSRRWQRSSQLRAPIANAEALLGRAITAATSCHSILHVFCCASRIYTTVFVQDSAQANPALRVDLVLEQAQSSYECH